MDKYDRILNLNNILSHSSAFLLGPRSVGKSWLWRHSVQPTHTYDLLDTQIFRRLQVHPELIFDAATAGKNELIVIDEVQKLPDLLNEVQRAIDQKGTRFLLTGSSARKLRRSSTNLLGGRAVPMNLLPLTSAEIPAFDLKRYLNRGGIPRHYSAEATTVASMFDGYVSLYLKEEIRDEALTRRLEDFSRFLDVMALHNGDELAIEAFSNDCGIKSSTFRNYLEVLKDTLIGFEVGPYLSTRKRKAITRPKLFLFDVGITGYLAGRGPLVEKSTEFGRAFEHWIALELRAYLNYHHKRWPLAYWRSTSQFEVDFIIGDELAIEVKSTDRVHSHHLNGLKALKEERTIKRFIVVSCDAHERTVDGIEIMPWQRFVKQLWDGELF